ncbi:hypothetical protein [Anaplasma bovis]|uniref:hypothetical protein n=1 Tax=Anaplasma bovis TaxID=186733 RepID=UPI002FF00A30
MHSGYTSERSSAARIDRTIHKYKVVVGCLVCMAVVLGTLLLHGAIKALYNVKSVFTVLYTLGFCVLLAAPLLLWSSYEYIQYIEKVGRGDYFPCWPSNVVENDYRGSSSAAEIDDNSLDLGVKRKVGSKSLETTEQSDPKTILAISSEKYEQPKRHMVDAQEPCGRNCSRNFHEISESEIQEPCGGSMHVEDTHVSREVDTHLRRRHTH